MTRTKQVMSDWQFWMVVAYLGLVGVMVALYFVNARTTEASARVAKESAIHEAELQSAKKQHTHDLQQKVVTCLSSRPELARINAFLAAVKTTHDVLEQNSRAVLKTTAMSDPDYQTRLHNYMRIKATGPSFDHVHFTVPTVQQCKARGH